MEYFVEKCTSIKFVKEDVDLADVEGEVKNINRDKFMLSKFASLYLDPRMIYVLVEIRQTDNKNYPNIVPLLENSEILNANFVSKLSPKPPKTQQKSQGQKGNQKGNQAAQNLSKSQSSLDGRNSSNKISSSPNSNK